MSAEDTETAEDGLARFVVPDFNKKGTVEAIPFPTDSSRPAYKDLKHPGLQLRVSKTGKAWIVRKRIGAKVIRVKLGDWPTMPVDTAYALALENLGMMVKGIDPLEVEEVERQRLRDGAVTLRDAIQANLSNEKVTFDVDRVNECLDRKLDVAILKKEIQGSATMKASTAIDKIQDFRLGYGDWLDTPLREIDSSKIAKRHAERSVKAGKSGGMTAADRELRQLKGIFNFARSWFTYPNGDPIIAHNPCDPVKHNQTQGQRRQTIIAEMDLAPWWNALDHLAASRPGSMAPLARDLFHLMLLTGTRPGELSTARWENFDLQAETLTLRDTKNRSDFTIYLTAPMLEIIQRRKLNAGNSVFIFPGQTSDTPITNVKRWIDLSGKAIGYAWTPNDLRRCYTSAAETVDMSALMLKRLVNHKSGDVTDGYKILDPHQIRAAQQKLTDLILNTVKPDTSKFVSFPSKAASQ